MAFGFSRSSIQGAREQKLRDPCLMSGPMQLSSFVVAALCFVLYRTRNPSPTYVTYALFGSLAFILLDLSVFLCVCGSLSRKARLGPHLSLAQR